MPTALTEISGIGPAAAKLLKKHGFKNVGDIAASSVDDLSRVPGFGPVRSKAVIISAKALMDAGELQAKKPSQPGTAKPAAGKSEKSGKKDKKDGKSRKNSKKDKKKEAKKSKKKDKKKNKKKK